MDEYNDYRGNTPLIAAAAEGDSKRIHELLTMYSQEGTLHQQLEESSSNDGSTALLWACMNADTDAVRLLLAAGADPTNPGKTAELYDLKITPLGVANERTLADGSLNEEIIEMLIAARIQRNEPRRAQRRIEAATPPFGKNYLRLVRKYTLGGSRRKRQNIKRYRGKDKTRRNK